jgi:16S rRNA processing protein RimM
MAGHDAARRHYVALAEVARPHGVQGELRLKVYNLDSDLLLSRPPIRLVGADGTARAAKIRSIRRVPGAMLARLAGVEDRAGAEQLRGAIVEVERGDLEPIAEESEHYVCDLIGCRVLASGAEVGEVVGFESYPTCDALVVERAEGGRLEVPLQASFVVSIDEEARVIEVANIEGL